jgi:NAD(P)-dependent dehydrogenase (short-subunit alcohol dehydrogenase family)
MREKQFLVVGGSHGIGQGIVHRLLHAGAEVTVVSRTLEASDCVPGLTHVQTDLMQESLDPQRLPDRLDGFAYCPGTINLAPVRQLNAESLIEDFRLNVVGAVQCLQAALPAMKAADHAAMLLFSTVAVAQGLPMHASVAAAKGAIEGLTRSLAAELAPKIRVNCIAPGLTSTPLSARFLSNDQKRAAMADRHPLKRYGEVSDIAAMAEYLLSDQATWITGQVIGVDGGMSSVRV